MKRNLPVMELYEKLSEKYKYDDEASFKDIFYPIILDAFVMYAHMAIRFQIITNIIINIENNLYKITKLLK